MQSWMEPGLCKGHRGDQGAGAATLTVAGQACVGAPELSLSVSLLESGENCSHN